jgi:uncharacterized membrane protein HdeD (DUF308 family)
MALVILFGLYALADGAVAFVGAFLSPREVREDWLVPLLGILSILIGVMTFARPGMTAMVLLFLIAARAVFVGCLEIAVAIHHRKIIRGEWLLIASGCLSVIFGMVVFAYPLAGALAIMWLIGVYAMAIGVTHVFFALFAKRLAEHLEHSVTPTPLPT